MPWSMLIPLGPGTLGARETENLEGLDTQIANQRHALQVRTNASQAVSLRFDPARRHLLHGEIMLRDAGRVS
jgi:hypothetical protein